MGLFDFLAQSPPAGPQGLLAQGGDAPPAPGASPQPQQEGFLSRLTSPNGLAVLGATLRSASGDQGAFSELGNMQAKQLQLAQYQRQLQLQQRGNQAFRAAYQNGKFDPQVYASVMGDALDPKAMAEMANTFKPKVSYQNDHVVTEDPMTAAVSVGAALPQSYAEATAAAGQQETGRHNLTTEQQAAQTAAEAVRHNQVEEGQGSQRIGLEGKQVGIAGAHLGLDQGNQMLERQKFAAQQHPGATVVNSPTDLARLPPGTSYIAPDGSVRVKKAVQ